MRTDLKDCPDCHAPLIEIDHYGERLIGCVECNQWKWRGGKSLVVELPQSDLDTPRLFMRWSAKPSKQ
jgi:hypothetical protein